jgi:lipopolysaccharide export system protein LptA
MKKNLSICLFLSLLLAPGALLGADTLGALKGKGGPIEITSDQKGPKPLKCKSEPGGGDLDRIEAVGNVKMVQLNRVVTGEKAVFLQDDQKIIVTGNPVMREGDNVIKGERIIVLLEENKGIVESSQNKRVTAVINPEKGKKK